MPLFGLAAAVRIELITPAKPAIAAESIKSLILVRLTSTPRARAALALPPEAWIQLPVLVRVNKMPSNTAAAINHNNDMFSFTPATVKSPTSSWARGKSLAFQVRYGKPLVT